MQDQIDLSKEIPNFFLLLSSLVFLIYAVVVDGIYADLDLTSSFIISVILIIFYSITDEIDA